MIEMETLGKPVSVFDKQVQCVVIQIPLEKNPAGRIERNTNCGFLVFCFYLNVKEIRHNRRECASFQLRPKINK